MDLALYARVQVDQAYGIEVEEFPARIAEVAMWLMDHQLNLRLSEAFGNLYLRLPLTRTAKIVHGNALTTDWETVAPKDQLSYILGNPPFIGYHLQTKEQKSEMASLFKGVNGAGLLDFASAWFYKAARYMQGTAIKAALVSTNSIVQGEQVGILWNELFAKYQIKIHFAHRTFKWNNEARGNAQVYCVIVGFGPEDAPKHFIYDYDTPRAEPQRKEVSRINSYLVEADNVLISGRTKPISQVPEMVNGNKPVDGGFFFFNDEEKHELLAEEPQAAPYIKPFLGAQEFLRNQNRWSLWLEGISPTTLKNLPFVAHRVNQVRLFRLESSKADTVRMAQLPTLFGQTRQPKNKYLLIPRHSSENRRYVPFGFFLPDIILGDSCMSIPNATPYLFGVMTSEMHMAWMRQICGRIKSDFRYSATLVYNNFPFPQSPTPKQTATVEAAAQAVLAARAEFPQESLATLYDPLTMPPALVRAHAALDRAVDACYRAAAFPTELSRLEFLFQQYRQLQAPLLPAAAPKAKRTPRKPA